MNKKAPKVSVVMAAFNAQKYIREAIDSILGQTFTDFEFIIINDGSTDNTGDIIQEYCNKDHRVIHLQNKYEKGIAGAVNTGLDFANAEYIARMDSDDISLPNRLHEQVDFLDKNTDFGVCGSWVKLIGIDKNIIWKNPKDPDIIKCQMLFYGAIANPSATIRKSIIDKHALRYEKTAAEDYEMFVRLSRVTKLTNIQKILLHYRMHDSNFGKVHRHIQNESANYIRLKQIKELDIDAREEELSIHNSIGFWNLTHNKEFLIKSNLWFHKIIEANNSKLIFDKRVLTNLLMEKWCDIYSYSTNLCSGEIIKFLKDAYYKKASFLRKVRVYYRIFISLGVKVFRKLL